MSTETTGKKPLVRNVKKGAHRQKEKQIGVLKPSKTVKEPVVVAKKSVNGALRLTARQQLFVDAWDGSIMSTSKTTGMSYSYCNRLIRSPHIIRAIKRRDKDKRETPIISDRKRRQAFWSQVMHDDTLMLKDRLKASELLGRSEADFTDNMMMGSLEDELKSLSDEDLARRIEQTRPNTAVLGTVH